MDHKIRPSSDKYGLPAQASFLIPGFLLITIFPFVWLPCSASIYGLKDEIDAYDRGDFEKARLIGRSIVNGDTEEDKETARYYLANACSRLNLTQEAIDEYSTCWKNARAPLIREYSHRALQMLQNSKKMMFTNDSHQFNDAEINHLSLSESKRAILQEEDSKINSLNRDAQLAIDEINTARDNELADPAPLYCPRSGTDFELVGWEARKTQFTEIRQQYQKQIDAVNSKLLLQLGEIKASYQKRLDALNDTVVAINSQRKSSNGYIQLILPPSNGYVRDYVNYVTDQPALSALKATPQTLMPKHSTHSAEGQ